MQINTSISAYQAYAPQSTNSGSQAATSNGPNAALNPVDTVDISSAALELPPEPPETQEESDNRDG